MNAHVLDTIIIALDNLDREQAIALLRKIRGRMAMVKIGPELYFRYGPDFIKKIHDTFGMGIFLDLKLHDIPNTVSQAIRSLSGLPLTFLTVHLSGGRNMLQAAVLQAKDSLPQTKLLGVSFLTSLDEEDFNGLWGIKPDGIVTAFKRLITLGISCDIPGLVLSAFELPMAKKIEKEKNTSLIKVCPGIRFPDEERHDQKRVATPRQAIQQGAQFLVMGRSLTSAHDIEKRLSSLQKKEK